MVNNSSDVQAQAVTASTPLTREEATMFFVTLMDGLKTREERFMEKMEAIVRKNSDSVMEMVNIIDRQSKHLHEVTGMIRAQNDSTTALVDKQKEQLLEVINKATAENTEAVRAIREAVSSIKIQPTNTAPIQNVNVFNNTMLPNDISIWKENQHGLVDAIARRTGDKHNAWVIIYDDMQEAGYDVDLLMKQYRKLHGNVSFIDMCANSDILRKAFVLSAKRVYQKCVTSASPAIKAPDIVNKPKDIEALIKNVDIRKWSLTPELLKKQVEPYMPILRSKYGITNFPFQFVYTQMRKDYGINLNAIKDEYVNKYGVKKYCSPGWIVTFDDALMKQFKTSLVNMLRSRYPECL